MRNTGLSLVARLSVDIGSSSYLMNMTDIHLPYPVNINLLVFRDQNMVRDIERGERSKCRPPSQPYDNPAQSNIVQGKQSTTAMIGTRNGTGPNFFSSGLNDLICLHSSWHNINNLNL